MPRPFVAALLVLSIALVAALGCRGKGDKPTVLTSPDGSRQITLPKGWSETKKLHDKADLQGADAQNELYVFVLSENKTDFKDMTLKRYGDLAREAFSKTLSGPTVSSPTDMTLGGNPAQQCEIRGATQGLEIVYLHTTVESKRSFSQIMAWTLRAAWDKNEKQLRDVTLSFKESDPPAAPTPSASK